MAWCRSRSSSASSSSRESADFFAHVSLAEFLGSTHWTPIIGEPKSYGVWPLLSATFTTAAIAMVVAVPLGLLAAIYLSEYAGQRTEDEGAGKIGTNHVADDTYAAAVEFAQTFGQLQATRSYRQLEDVAEAQFIDIARRRAEIAFDRKRLRRSGERGH